MSFASTFDDLDDAQPLSESAARTAWIVFGALVALVALAYGNMLAYTSTFWSKGLYSHGWIVPLFAAYLFWIRKRPLLEVSDRERWGGVAILAASLALRVWASYYDYNNPQRLSFIGALLGVCVMVGGWSFSRWSMLRWAGPAVLFLLFMFPLPSILENTILMKLQTVATAMSTWTLQLMGISAARQGNVLSIDTLTKPLQVAEACSGLRMLTIFGAMTVALVMIIERPWWQFFYFSFSTLSPVGYGDIVPATMQGRSFTIIEQLVAVFYVAILISRLTGMYTSSSKPR